MEFNEFKRIVTSFADQVDDVMTIGEELLLQIRDETITCKLHRDQNHELVVEEHDTRLPARTWIVNRLARLPLLADRICSYVNPPQHFVSPSGHFLDRLDIDPLSRNSTSDNIVDTMVNTLDRRPVGATSVLFLTSDAGEGKTSLIDHVAVKKAEEYKNRKTDWLLVPIALGGRPFLRFDDVVISALVNKLRFQLLYYDAFLELVQLGVLVPAFDGFEEMIIDSGSGEAISALGNLLGKLRSQGAILVAARKAYFEYSTFGSQARLFDTIGQEESASFQRLSLSRWSRVTFERYAARRDVRRPDRLYQEASTQLGSEHPVLTRAVLVKRLVDVAVESESLSSILDRISNDEKHYFYDFVDGIVEREANFKWIDKSGTTHGALLTIDQHHTLLAMIAEEMWLSGTDELGDDVTDFLVELFVETFTTKRRMVPGFIREIQQRIRQHALLIVKKSPRPMLLFDHEDFRLFFLGQALGRSLILSDIGAVRLIIDRARLSPRTVLASAGFVRRQSPKDFGSTLELLQELADEVQSGALSQASFMKENCGVLALALLDGEHAQSKIRNMAFPTDALRGSRLCNVSILNSFFNATDLGSTQLRQCRFMNCHFHRIGIDGSQRISNTTFDERCRIESVALVGSQSEDLVMRFEPQLVIRELRQAGFGFPTNSARNLDSGLDEDSYEDDEDLILVQRFLRAFLRSTFLYESTIKQRLGARANHFVKELLPRLRQAGVVLKVPGPGGNSQYRFRLSVQMTHIERAMKNAGGRFEKFLSDIADR